MNLFGKLGKGITGLMAKVSNPFGASDSTQKIKLPARSQASPSFVKKSNLGSGQALPRLDRGLANKDITSYRYGRDTQTIIRDFANSTPDLSASVDAYIRTAVTSNYTSVAYNLDGTPNREATQALQFLITRFDTLNNYADGFSNTPSIRSIAESLAKEFRYHGAACMELVLDKHKLPSRLQPIAVNSIKFESDKSGALFPTQEVDGEKVSLDIPTFFYRSIDQDLTTPYSVSPMESAIQPVLFMQEFLNDLRRVVQTALYPRLQVKLNTKDIMAAMPVKYRGDEQMERDYLNSVVNDVAEHINGLNPEDALVFLDRLDVSFLDRGNVSLDTELGTLHEIINAKTSTSVKTMPSVLGHGSASNNIASTETLLFMKSAEGLQFALNDLISQALTLSVRLLGYDCYVEFKFSRIDLRPDSELEAFRSMKQDRVLKLLSIGILTDEQATMELVGSLPHADAPVLSGTGFYSGGSSDIGNPYSNTNKGALNQNLDGDSPKNAKSQNGGKKGRT